MMKYVCRIAAFALLTLPGVWGQMPHGMTSTMPKVATQKGKRSVIKQLDINGASKEELKALPGVTDELAAKIVKGRPYKSKANLVTHKVLPPEVYEVIKKYVKARQSGDPK